MVSSAFKTTKNAVANAPIWLYRVEIDGTPTNDLFLTEWDENISYFNVEGNSQVYVARPMQHNGLEQNGQGRIDGLNVTIIDVTGEVQYYLENYNGLRGKKVTILQVFYERLADPSDYIADVFYINSVSANDAAITFTLTSRLDLLDQDLPRRRYARNHCPWNYKEDGCWYNLGNGTFTPQDKFHATETILFASKEISSLLSASPKASAKFHPIDMSGLWREAESEDYLKIDLKCSDASKLTSSGQLEITSDAVSNTHEWHWTGLNSKGVTTAWKTFTFYLKDVVAQSGELDVSGINYVAWKDTPASGNLQLFWRNARIARMRPYGFVVSTADACDRTFADCKRHNNQDRFGGFPGVPKKTAR